MKSTRGHGTQLGAGVVIPDIDSFTRTFVVEFAKLKGEFGIETDLPFMPANGLLKHGRRKAIAFADRLVTSIQDEIEHIHCSFVSLSPKKYSHVPVEGMGTPAYDVPTRSFIDSLGPMFSYLAAQSCIYNNRDLLNDTEIRIDSFTSKQTRAWDILEKMDPKIYWKGDECDPAIACADLLAFLTDAKLYSGYHKIEPENISKVWTAYPFHTSTGVYGHSNLWSYAWYSNKLINTRPYLAGPTVFLSIDKLKDPSAGTDKSQHADETSTKTPHYAEPVPITFHRAIKQSDAYNAAVRHAFNLSGSLKIFKFDEDFGLVRDKDVFVYIGEKSMKVGKALQDAVDITVMSGMELRRLIKKATN